MKIEADELELRTNFQDIAQARLEPLLQMPSDKMALFHAIQDIRIAMRLARKKPELLFPRPCYNGKFRGIKSSQFKIDQPISKQAEQEMSPIKALKQSGLYDLLSDSLIDEMISANKS